VESRVISFKSGDFMRSFIAALVATSLVVSSAYAANESVVPLPAGKPAGIKEAAYLGPNAFLILIGFGVFIGGIALAISNDDKNGVTTPTTTATSTLP
jgi:hypothetical protein